MTVPNLINDSGLNELLRRRYNVQESSPAPSLAYEVFPTAEVAPFSPDLYYLAGWRICGAYANVAAAPGSNAQVFLRNPATSRTLAVIESIIITTNVDVVLGIFPGELVGATGVGPSLPLDTRWRVSASGQQTTMVVTSDNTTSLPGAARFFDYISGPTERSRFGPLVLTPGFTLIASTVGLNLPLNSAWRWRERSMLPGE